ncbi:hypothetical protein ACFLUT_03415, partial [Chloroflexota bacterium]
APDVGFEVYVAKRQQRLEGLKENIFRELQQSEYFLFIDFCRERVCDPTAALACEERPCRGSLFAHQELGLAAFLGLDCLLFSEEGLLEREGVLGTLQGNSIRFRDRSCLPSLVVSEVQRRVTAGLWDPRWKNQMHAYRTTPDEYESVDYVAKVYRPSRYYHVAVQNDHRDRVAYDCVVFLDTIVDLKKDQPTQLELTEFKWKGVTSPTVPIPPGGIRFFDAFHVDLARPQVAMLGVNLFTVDYSGYLQELTGPGDFLLTWSVYSSSLPAASVTLKLHLDKDVDWHSLDVV